MKMEVEYNIWASKRWNDTGMMCSMGARYESHMVQRPREMRVQNWD